MKEHQVEEIAEVGERKTSKGGEEGTDGIEGREEVVDEVIERVRQDPELDEQEQMLLGCIVYVVPLESPCRNINWHLWTSGPPPTHSSFYLACCFSATPYLQGF